MFPPKVIEVRVDKAKSQSIQKTLTVYGTAEGRRLPLKSINLFVHASSPNCLQVLGSKTLEFRSISPAGVEGKKVTLVNNCSEEVQISSLNYPGSLGENKLNIRSIEARSGEAALLQKGQEAEFLIELEKSVETQKGGFNAPLTISGLLIRSRQKVESQPISLRILIGAEGLGSGAATAINVPLCENKNETISLNFPKPAIAGDCSSGYCDSVEAAQFITKKIGA